MSQARGFRALIIGPPGCGKGFISKMIVKKYGAFHISTGDMLRDHIRFKTPIGKQAQGFMSRGELVPDKLLTDIVQTGLSRAQDRNFVLDGYPRNVSQAHELDEYIGLDFVLHLDVPPRAIIAKVKNRLVHPASGRVYNEGALAPRVPGRDDVTGEPLERRADDLPHIIMNRLKGYEKQILPVVAHYRKKYIVHSILVRQHESMWPQVKRYLSKRWKKRYTSPFRPNRRVNFTC